MKNDLQTLFHIISDKSSNITFPNIPKKYIHHFIRGYFDGDGHINYKGYTVSFVGGSTAFMESLQALLLKYGFNPYMTDNGKHIRVFIHGRKSLKQFGDWMYTDKSLYLKRKFAAFDQEKLSVISDELQDRKRNRSYFITMNMKQIEEYKYTLLFFIFILVYIIYIIGSH
jgi:LAGLIDADG-like domain